MLRVACVLLSIIAAAAAASSAAAATFNVTTTADSGAGSLRAAILASNAQAGAHRIEFTGGFPTEGVILLDSALPQIQSSSLTIAGGAREPRIDGRGQHRVFIVSSLNQSLRLEDLFIRNGLASFTGGCVNSAAGAPGTLELIRVVLTNCRAAGGDLVSGGAVNWQRGGGQVRIDDSLLVNNQAVATAPGGRSEGGALRSSVRLEIRRSFFHQNSASSSAASGGGIGGAISLSTLNDSTSTIFASEFVGNSTFPSGSFGRGGAINLGNRSTLLISSSWLRGNAANQGAGVYASRSDTEASIPRLLITQTSLVNNAATTSGGAVQVRTASFASIENTYYNNSANAGAHLGFDENSSIELFFFNLLAPTFSGNPCQFEPALAGQDVVGFNLVAGSGCSFAQANALPNAPLGTITIDETPGLMPVVRFTGAAVIDSIPLGQSCSKRDVRGYPRPQDGDGDGIARCDVGAFEHPPSQLFANGFEP